MNVEDGTESALVMYANVMGDSSLVTVEESGKNHGSVNKDICLVLQACVLNAFVQSTK